MNIIKKNLLKNSLATGTQKVVALMDSLLLVPFFISNWGVAYYGEWLTLTVIPTVLSLSNLGIGTAASNRFVLNYGAETKKKAEDIFKTGFAIVTFVMICGIVISAFVLFILNEFEVFEKSLIQKEEAIWAISLLILARLIGFYNPLFFGRFVTARRASLSIHLITIKTLVELGFGLLVLNLGYGIIPYAISRLAIAVLFNVFYAFKALNVLKIEKEHKGSIKKKYAKSIAQKGIAYLMSPVWQSIYFQGTTFVVRIVLGPEAVTVFNTVRKLSRTVNQVLNMIVQSIFPEFQYEIAQGNTKKSHKLFRVSIIIVFFTALIGAFSLSVFGLWFYEIWTNSTIEVPIVMWNVFIVSILFNSLWWASTMVYSALDKPYYFALSGVLAATVSVVASYFLAQFLGLNGVAIGSLSLDLILSFLMLPYACKLLKIKKSDLIAEGFKDFKNMAVQVFVKILRTKHTQRNDSLDDQKITNQSTTRSKTTNSSKNKN